MAKGAGMLAPGLATMLVVLTTDADLDADALDKALRDATRITFDRVDSDGCMSTNDTVLLLASGASGVDPGVRRSSPRPSARSATTSARQLIGDAEGASKDIRVEVVNAATEDDAVEVGRSIARNNLLKCADPRRGPQLGPGAVRDRHHVRRLRARPAERRHQRRLGVQERRASARTATCVDMRYREVAHHRRPRRRRRRPPTIWTNDLTADYVHENSAYSS